MGIFSRRHFFTLAAAPATAALLGSAAPAQARGLRRGCVSPGYSCEPAPHEPGARPRRLGAMALATSDRKEHRIHVVNPGVNVWFRDADNNPQNFTDGTPADGSPLTVTHYEYGGGLWFSFLNGIEFEVANGIEGPKLDLDPDVFTFSYPKTGHARELHFTLDLLPDQFGIDRLHIQWHKPMPLGPAFGSGSPCTFYCQPDRVWYTLQSGTSGYCGGQVVNCP